MSPRGGPGGGASVSPPAFERALAAAFAVPDDQFALGEAALDAADVPSGGVAQHVASLHIRLDTPDRATAAVADNTVGVDVVARIEKMRGIALTGCRDGGTGGEGKEKSDDRGLHDAPKGNVRMQRSDLLPSLMWHHPLHLTRVTGRSLHDFACGRAPAVLIGVKAASMTIQELSQSRSFTEGQATPNRLTDQFTVHHRGVDDHPAIEVKAGTIFDHFHPTNMGMRGAQARAQTNTCHHRHGTSC